MNSFLLIGSIVTVVAGAAQSSIGFGMSMIMAPCLMLVLDPVAVVPTILLVDVINCVLVTLRYRGHVRPRMVILPSASGFAAGIQVLTRWTRIHAHARGRARAGIYCRAVERLAQALPGIPVVTLPVGMASGLAGGATSMSGPPVVLFMANQGHHQTVRANLIAYFSLIEIYGIANFWWAGALTREVVVHAALLMPAMLLGTAIGFLLGPRIPEKVFRNIIFCLLLVIGIALVVNSLGNS